ncbi:glucarate dehydratase [Streptacidiphilus sp. PB12-B1b]|uniref:glucarate dehydratase family protein n=1 Tax=Streptacidiphilus sp. PB12-B1b TaxID=2705012 RepID=UPI0015FDA7D7|nr:glucarate dehydratase family protein [Streptacidiphilus sp. PB12-B1b]QMU74536.1 glucarate dehydratase [Streptacidiphilus sp. PB12-B1b]
MRIRQVTVTPVAFRDPPLLNAVGVHEPYALRSVVQLHCDDGIVGLGESYGDDAFLALLDAAARAVVGLDVFHLGLIQRAVGAAVGGGAFADSHGLTGGSSTSKTVLSVFAAFEVACLDAQGKAVGRPVADLLGGAVRDSVPFSAYLFYKWAGHPGAAEDAWGEALDPDAVVGQARRMIDRYGFGAVKLKGGVLPPEEEIEAVLALRAAFPELPLRLDPNAAWSVPTALRVAERLDGVLEYLEDPVAGIAPMAEVARQAPMPLATNMCVVAPEHLAPAMRQRAVGVLLSDHHYWGGLRHTQQLSGLCADFGVGLSMHSNSHLGISLAAMVQVAAATEHLTYACDTHWPWKPEDEDVIVPGALEFSGGAVAVPDAPGLGVELDPDALARLHELYLRCGLRRRDDTGYMRSFVPDFRPRPPGW